MHFAPTGCSWLNMVERLFRDLTENRLRRGVFRSVEELIAAVFNSIDQHNDNPKPFTWTAGAESAQLYPAAKLSDWIFIRKNPTSRMSDRVYRC
jgi:hypothetical protein